MVLLVMVYQLRRQHLQRNQLVAVARGVLAVVLMAPLVQPLLLEPKQELAHHQVATPSLDLVLVLEVQMVFLVVVTLLVLILVALAAIILTLVAVARVILLNLLVINLLALLVAHQHIAIVEDVA